eukprot:3941372-Rhodomonas_salina.3
MALPGKGTEGSPRPHRDPHTERVPSSYYPLSYLIETLIQSGSVRVFSLEDSADGWLGLLRAYRGSAQEEAMRGAVHHAARCPVLTQAMCYDSSSTDAGYTLRRPTRCPVAFACQPEGPDGDSGRELARNLCLLDLLGYLLRYLLRVADRHGSELARNLCLLDLLGTWQGTCSGIL